MVNTPAKPRLAASNSFTAEEIRVLDYILSKLLIKQSAGEAVRMRGFAGLCGRAKAMKKRIAEIELIRGLKP